MILIAFLVITGPALLLASVLMLVHVANRLIAVEREVTAMRATLHAHVEDHSIRKLRETTAANDAIIRQIAAELGVVIPPLPSPSYRPASFQRIFP